MELLQQLFDFFLQLDDHLYALIREYGAWTYAVLFLIIFCETGLVVTPFLPGDSLLFAAGAISATGALDPHLTFLLLTIAAILGDTVNYAIGHYIGPKAFTGRYRFLKREYLEKTHEFYERYGGKTIIIGRYVPIVRTFAPFVAGIGAMTYKKFVIYNVLGGVLWVGSLVYAGYFFGNIPVVRDNFGAVVLAIVIISVVPMFIEFLRRRMAKRRVEPEGS